MSAFALFRGLLEPADGLLDPTRRVHWLFLAGSAALAAAVLLGRGVGTRNAARALLSPRIWFHRSAVADYQLIAVKAVLRAVLLGSYGVSTLALAGISAGWLRRHLGMPGLHLSAPIIGALFTLTAFVVEDWSRFLVHRLMHRVPLLWEFHKVHHSAEVLTPLSLYRTHPVESMINGARGAVAVGLTTGVCVWLFGPALHAWELLGVDAIGFVWTLLGANLRHSHVWVSYGARIEHWFVSPAQHQIHHSRDARHVDRNFGTILAIWDRLGDSLYVTTARPEPIRFGLAEGDTLAAPGVAAMIVMPLWNAARRIVTTATSSRGSKRWRPATAVALACLALLPAGCTPPPTMPRLDRRVLLQSFGRCTVDVYTQFQSAADALHTATTTYATMPDETSRAAARTAWERAIDTWEVAELLQYGPAANFETAGGLGMRAHIYSWPDVNRCLIEEQIVTRAYEGDFANLSTSTRGLAAIEYLLFYAGTANACDPINPINVMGTWAALTPAEITQRRADYARVAAADLVTRARDLIVAWQPDAFLAQLESGGQGSRLFATQQVAISAAAEATFYVDTDVKDRRLGHPLGITNCPTGACADAVESPFADRGKQHLRNNLAGLRVLLQGCAAGNSLGFDDLLESAGAGMLASQMNTDLDAVGAAIEAIPGESLSHALVNDRASVVRVHESVREITNFLKVEFTATLQISSRRLEGDND